MKYCLAFSVLFCACNLHRSSIPDVQPDLSLVKGFHITKDKVLYQYYEKFGFTTACTHSRTYFKADNFIISEGWKKLPLDSEALAKINGTDNKVDTIVRGKMPIRYGYKGFFSDISLDSFEYITHAKFRDSLNLDTGFYKIEENAFYIYNGEEKTMYYEFHSCE